MCQDRERSNNFWPAHKSGMEQQDAHVEKKDHSLLSLHTEHPSLQLRPGQCTQDRREKCARLC